MSSQHLTTTQHFTVCTVDGEKAWHLLSILLKIGRPACPEELASKCGLFGASPEYVQYLCSISGSPICLMECGFVTVSMVAVLALGEFVVKAIGGYVPRTKIRVLGSKRVWDSDVRTYFRKRKGSAMESFGLSTPKRRLSLPCGNGEGDHISSHLPSGIRDTYAEEPADIANTRIGNMNFLSINLSAMEFESVVLNKEKAVTSLLMKSTAVFPSLSMAIIEPIEGEHEVGTNVRKIHGSVHIPKCLDRLFDTETDSNLLRLVKVERSVTCQPDLNSTLPICQYGNSVSCKEIDEQHNASPLEAGIHDSHAYEVPMSQLAVDAGSQVGISGKECCLVDSGIAKEEREKFSPLDKAAKTDEVLLKSLELANPMNIMALEKYQTRKVGMQGSVPSAKHPASQKPAKSFGKLKAVHNNALPPQPRVLLESFQYNKVVNSPKQQDQCESGPKLSSMKQKLKQSHGHNMHAKENMVDTISTSAKDHLEKKALPHFESFIIEQEEGSGGYGTVYRAQRKNDGKRFAIKCPHDNALKHHASNELKMLDRFGGRNFIIKYEGSFRRGNNECFVLEHVEHDRPEVLKREIDIFQLQWYGYCMFRALACLHKQRVVHRDVKPGNFLFSRKLNKGYLIDFNLAMDLQQKYGIGSKSKSSYNTSFDRIPLPRSDSAPSTKDQKLVRGISAVVNLGEAIDSKQAIEPKNMKKRASAGLMKVCPDLSGRNIFRSQGAEGSGITSTMDATSTRTPSAERIREPLPCLGRKELINLVQDTMQSPNHDSVNIPASQRKRVAAPPGKVDSKNIYPSPMPLHSNGVAVGGAGLLRSKGDGKHKKEGPCVGTKGFRAPEVLFRSLYQGSKVDVWSAGVTLLYLMVGRSPFVGDPEQNIKDIAKLRGSEDLWEVAKLHNRESSFPVELFDMQYLPPVELQNWCKINTKRPNFFKLIPRSLFDLVDKCLTVNPRLRISAEEALRHEFFAPCHESLRKQRMLRQGLISDFVSDQSGHLVHGQNQLKLEL